MSSSSPTPPPTFTDPRIGAALPPARNPAKMLALLAATCFLFAAAWAFVFFVQKPRVADGAITRMTVFPLHSELRQGGAPTEGVGGGTQIFDEVLVWTAIEETNLTDETPLYATRQRATLTLSDGQQLFSDAQGRVEVARAQKGLPALQGMQGPLLPRELTLAPRQTARGLALFVFPITAEMWNARKEFSLAISFQWQRDLPLREPGAAQRSLMPTIDDRKHH